MVKWSGNLRFLLQALTLSVLATKALEHQPGDRFTPPQHEVPAAFRSHDYVPDDPRVPEEPRPVEGVEESFETDDPLPRQIGPVHKARSSPVRRRHQRKERPVLNLLLRGPVRQLQVLFLLPWWWLIVFEFIAIPVWPLAIKGRHHSAMVT